MAGKCAGQRRMTARTNNRLRINAYTCGGCLDGLWGQQRRVFVRMEIDCSSEGRVQLTPYSCGGCAAGYARDSAGECRRIPCPSGFADANGNCPETPQAAQCAAAAADGASVRRWGAKLDDGGCLPVQTCLFGSAETQLRLNGGCGRRAQPDVWLSFVVGHRSSGGGFSRGDGDSRADGESQRFLFAGVGGMLRRAEGW